ncbi:MAG TPA: VanZ family protein, partial [Candidatus Krumholzibacteria bacterium]|nr:VanZ family protein [Candidatus Krumholzibacteria bacterium]
MWIALALAYVALIFFVSSRPYLHAPGPEFDMKDKLAHATEYGVLGALLALAFARGSVRAPAVSLLLVVAIGATIASADEMFQGTVPGRQRDIADWVADVSGVVIGGGIVLGGA